MRSYLTIVCLAASITTGSAASEPQPASGPAVVLPLSQMPRRPVVPYGPELLIDLAKRYPAFQHSAFDTSGFALLMLPFRVDTDADADLKAKACALSFLLSNDLDWARGNYSSRHAYFFLRHHSAAMRPLATKYDPPRIAYLIGELHTTHAVGGRLAHDKNGYTGELEISDRTGRLVCNKTYDTPRTFFDLLGDMGTDAMTFLGHTPSDALVKRLHLKRCNDDQSLIDLGMAGAIPDGDDGFNDVIDDSREAEFALYEKILKRDPGFADVRYWYATQRYWTHRDRNQLQAEYVLTLKSYLVEPALWDLDYTTRANPAVDKDYASWLDEANVLAGPECHAVLHQRIATALATGNMPEKDWALMDAHAARYPNNYWFLVRLAEAWTGGRNLRADAEMGAGLYIAAMQNNYVVDNAMPESLDGLGYCMTYLGRHGEAAGIYAQALALRIDDGDADVLRPAVRTVEALMQLGRFDQALQVATMVLPQHMPDDVPRQETAIKLYALTGTCAAVTGNRPVLDSILAAWPETLAPGRPCRMTLQAYADLLDGLAVNTKQLMDAGKAGSLFDRTITALFCMQADLLNGGREFYFESHELQRYRPNEPILWFLLDQYDRQRPDQDLRCFYLALTWLMPDDPWTTQTATDRRTRLPEPKTPDFDRMEELLDMFETDRWPTPDPVLSDGAWQQRYWFAPGKIAGAAALLIQQGKIEQAETLARKFHTLSVHVNRNALRIHANQILHRIERTRRKTTDTQHPQ